MAAFRYQARSDEDWERRASQQGGGFQGYISDEYRLYMVKKGENAVRILPPTWDGAKHYGMDVYTHFGVGPDKATVLCPLKMAEQPCPVCEARMLAEKRGDEDLVKELRASKRVLVWVIDRKDEDKGPVVWGMPWTLDRDITKVSRDRTTGKFYFVDHHEEGFDVYFDKDGEGIATKYTGVQLARRATSVDPNWLEYVQAHPLPETLLVRDYDEIKQLFEGGRAAEPPAEEPRPITRAATNGAERPAPSERPSRPVLNRPPLNVRPATEEPALPLDPPFDVKPSGEPPPEEADAPAPRRPAPPAPAEREPVPAAASQTASKAASLRERFARKST
jgi:hypothetical protein